MILFLLLSALLSCYKCGVIKKENVTSLGSWRTLPLDAEEVTKLTTFIADAWYEDSYSLYWYKVKTQHASVQVQNGIIYQIDLIFEPTGCLKEEDFETCKKPALEDMEVEACHFYTQDSSSDSSPILFSVTCVNI
ncbi:uncharacterized protein LOC143933648 [Lithobates pipiens]